MKFLFLSIIFHYLLIISYTSSKKSGVYSKNTSREIYLIKKELLETKITGSQILNKKNSLKVKSKKSKKNHIKVSSKNNFKQENKKNNTFKNSKSTNIDSYLIKKIILNNIKIKYPFRSKVNNQTGTVLLKFDIIDNQLKNISIKKTSGFKLLDQAALKGLHKVQIELDENISLKENFVLPIEFKLKTKL